MPTALRTVQIVTPVADREIESVNVVGSQVGNTFENVNQATGSSRAFKTVQQNAVANPKSRTICVLNSYDPAAVALFAAMSVQPSPARAALYNTLIVALKAAGVWTKLDFLYLFAAANSQAALLNVKNPGTFNATLVNAPPFTTDRGFGGLATAYVNSNFTPSTAGGQYAKDSAHAGGRNLLTSIADANAYILGATSQVSPRCFILPRAGSSNAATRINTNTTVSPLNANMDGAFVLNRPDSATSQLYRNGATLGDIANNSTAILDKQIIFLSDGPSFATALRVASGHAGSSLTAGNVAAFYAAELAYQQGVGAV